MREENTTARTTGPRPRRQIKEAFLCQNQGVEFGGCYLSWQSHYENHAGYVAAVKAAADKLVAAGFLLPEDATRQVSEAERSDVLR